MRPEIRGPEINVTPLVDVVLVLLIIFMVVVPQLEAGAAVTPPKAEHFDQAGELAEALTIMIDPGGALFLDKQPIDRAGLRAGLADQRRRDPHRPVRIKADRAVAYRIVRDVYRIGQTAGYPGIGLEVGEPDEDEPASAGGP